ncbi:MAG: hypothetical protein BGN87_03700 [Rhizobiales bacterium 65-79]|jgi:hypothetical protein|nr:hypothetical protein [Hyphomicrobiales bacterium]OJU04880.1 MAG: hypothetical protein BGN87_03700 [Rhizobiales bacterium 65-79]
MADAWTIANALRLAAGCARDASILLDSHSRNAAYLGEQALEQIIRAFATAEGLHIERHDAHQLDKTVRRFPDAHPEKVAISKLVWLEAYATTFRYTLPSGRIPKAPDDAKVAEAISGIEELILRAARHFGVDLEKDSPAARTAPMR